MITVLCLDLMRAHVILDYYQVVTLLVLGLDLFHPRLVPGSNY